MSEAVINVFLIRPQVFFCDVTMGHSSDGDQGRMEEGHQGRAEEGRIHVEEDNALQEQNHFYCMVNH